MLIIESLLTLFLVVTLAVFLSFCFINLTRDFFGENNFLKHSFRLILILFTSILSILNFPIIYQIMAITTMKPQKIRTYFVEVQEYYVGDMQSKYSQKCLQKKKDQFSLLKKYIY